MVIGTTLTALGSEEVGHHLMVHYDYTPGQIFLLLLLTQQYGSHCVIGLGPVSITNTTDSAIEKCGLTNQPPSKT